LSPRTGYWRYQEVYTSCSKRFDIRSKDVFQSALECIDDPYVGDSYFPGAVACRRLSAGREAAMA